jgi:hypothetical protein
MPDLSKRPLHTLRRSELIAKLRTPTHGPFQGWETVPTW